MLVSLKIENFALIDHLSLSLSPGLSVLTGETGAGKSIILDAIDAVLGGKVSSRLVRTGAHKAEIEATFQLLPAVERWLSEQNIPVITRNWCAVAI
jgi:DNA repair protein RecN (Recombination protein N)